MRGVREIALALGAAVLAAAAFPPVGLQLVAWVAWVPLLVAIRRAGGAGRAMLLAWAWLLSFAWLVGAWLPRSVEGYFGQPAAVGILAFLGVATMMAGLEAMAFAVCYRRLARLPPVVVPILAAAAWVAGDLARVSLFTGCPWGLAGYSQVGSDRVVQIADGAGVYGVTFVLLLVNAALAELWLRRAWAGVVVAGVVVAAVLGYGQLRLDAFASDAPASETVAIVQPDVDVAAHWREDQFGAHLDVYLELTRAVLASTPATLVVWPESALAFFVETEPRYRAAIGRVLAETGTSLVAGGPREAGDAYFNAAFLLSPDGAITARYDKQQLLPFAEYLPWRGLDALTRRFGRVREFTHGASSAPFETPIGRAGVLVCNEAFFGDVARDRVARGAEVLLALTNDGWVDDRQFATMATDMLRMRAVEQRRWVVRASTSGPSGVIDAVGRMRVSADVDVRAAITGEVRARPERSPYSVVGDVFAFACAATTLCALLAAGGVKSVS